MKKKIDNSVTSLNKTCITGQDVNQTVADFSNILEISEDGTDE